MFYSHEILTSRKYGVATVWLVATLGSKSNLKKVNRKAITEVDVTRACDTILDQEAPLALRLQSNLLYGVTRVYSQQCGYVLADAQATQNNIKALLKVVKGSFLDTEAGKTRSDALLLQDDPGFLPDLPNLDFDFTSLDLGSLSTNHDLSLLSPFEYDSNAPRLTTGRSFPPRLDLTTSNTGSLDYGLGGFNVPSSRPSLPDANAFNFDPLMGETDGEAFLPDVDFEFDANGNVRELVPESNALVVSRNVAQIDSGSITRERVRGDLEGLQWLREDSGPALGFDDGLPPLDNFGLPEPEPFLDTNERAGSMHVPSSSSHQLGEELSSEFAEAPIRRRRNQSVKTLPVDLVMELRNSELTAWSNDYVTNMARTTEKRQFGKAAAQAKKNSQYWVLNRGIGGISHGAIRPNLPSPLDVFSGESLMKALSIDPVQLAGTKHTPDPEEAGMVPKDEDRRKARRIGEADEMNPRELMNVADDEVAPTFDDNEIEVGRAAMPELEDGSSTMPWNIGASARRLRPESSASRIRQFYENSLGGFPTSAGASFTGPELAPGSASRRASRLTSASPLGGRGHSGAIERLSSLEVADDDNAGGIMDQTGIPNLNEKDQFELFGPAATVDTQTAVQTQWFNQAFEQESLNFLDYVYHSIEQNKEREGLNENAPVDSQVPVSEVTFGELVKPDSNTKIVASQAFLHLLSLATKNLLRTRQEANGGEILIGPLINV